MFNRQRHNKGCAHVGLAFGSYLNIAQHSLKDSSNTHPSLFGKRIEKDPPVLQYGGSFSVSGGRLEILYETAMRQFEYYLGL
jgi:hypothetical protein